MLIVKTVLAQMFVCTHGLKLIMGIQVLNDFRIIQRHTRVQLFKIYIYIPNLSFQIHIKNVFLHKVVV